MKRWSLFAGIVLLGIASVVVSERRKVDTPASPAALLYLVADSEQELTRMPVRFARMPDEEEIRIGNELARKHLARPGEDKLPEVPIVEHYLTRVGEQVARDAHRKLPYRFHYIPEPSFINAFALPGGHVFVGAGLLELMDSEDELAAVLGHEIEHIDHYHCAERVQRERALRKIPLGALVALPIEVFEAGYSKDQEMEADREGTRLAVQAGYSANGAIRMFETFARLLEEYESKAKTPQEEISRVAQQMLAGYFRSHPLPSERIAQVRTMMASEGWTVRPERNLEVAFLFWTAKARRALEAKQYARAEQLAAQSLRMRPDQPQALQTLAVAQFVQANFSGAANAYRRILEIDHVTHPEIITDYAQALAAADRANALSEFRQWADTTNNRNVQQIDVSEAGLALIAGNPEAARKLQAELERDNGAEAPFRLSELGWWYYQAGDYQKAVDLLSDADQSRPGNWGLRQQLAWAQIEMRRYRDALESANKQSNTGKILSMVRAVVHWQTQEHDLALSEFDSTLRQQPEWANPEFVKALYSPLVAQTMEQIKAERTRRSKESARERSEH